MCKTLTLRLCDLGFCFGETPFIVNALSSCRGWTGNRDRAAPNVRYFVLSRLAPDDTAGWLATVPSVPVRAPLAVVPRGAGLIFGAHGG